MAILRIYTFTTLRSNSPLYACINIHKLIYTHLHRFITQEVNLFKRRLERVSINPNDYKEFMRKYGLKFDLVSREERDEKRDRLIGLSDVTEGSFYNTSFYRYV